LVLPINDSHLRRSAPLGLKLDQSLLVHLMEDSPLLTARDTELETLLVGGWNPLSEQVFAVRLTPNDHPNNNSLPADGGGFGKPSMGERSPIEPPIFSWEGGQ